MLVVDTLSKRFAGTEHVLCNWYIHNVIWMSAQRVALREINVDTLVSTLTQRGRHYRHRLVTLRRGKQSLLWKTHTWSAGFEPGTLAWLARQSGQSVTSLSLHSAIWKVCYLYRHLINTWYWNAIHAVSIRYKYATNNSYAGLIGMLQSKKIPNIDKKKWKWVASGPFWIENWKKN